MTKALQLLINSSGKHRTARKLIAKRIEKIAREYVQQQQTSFREGVEYAISLPETWQGYECLI